MLSTHSSPAVVSAAAAGKLPRWLLLAVLIAFVLPLFFSSDVWSGRTMTSFGVAWTMVNGSLSDWLLPNINGIPITDVGPLSYWFEALSIKLFGGLIGNVSAFHITAGIWFALTTASIWYATYLLSRRDEAQPISFVFGGEAERKDYGRSVADIAVLMTVGTYGMIVAFHELTALTALMAFGSLALYGIVLSLQYLWRGSIFAGLSIGGVVLVTSPGVGLWCVLAAWVAIFLTPDYTSRSKRAVITLSCALLTALIWPLLVFFAFPAEGLLWFRDWLQVSLQSFAPLPLPDYPWLLKNLAWLTFPLWPFAIWGVYAWRAQIHQAPLAIPLSFSAVALCSILFTGSEPNSTILFLVPSLSILASLGIVSLNRSRENFLDLYSGIIYTLTIAACWLYFFAWTQGVPVKMGYSLTRLAPQVTHHGTSAFLFVLAVTATLCWLGFVFWRIFKHPLNVWRGALMNGAGLTAVWIIVMSLFLNLIDGARSMYPIVTHIKSAMVTAQYPQGASISENNLSISDIAAFNYWGDVYFSKNPDSEWKIVVTENHSVDIPPSLQTSYEIVDVIAGRPRSGRHFLLLKRLP